MSRRSDVFSLGAMLYHLLSGRPPFGGGSISESLKLVETQEPVSPRLVNSGVPLYLETFCLKCLEKDPNRRYQTSRELSEELGRFLKDESIHARPVGRPEKLWRWGRRNPLAASFVGTVCAALVFSLWLLVVVNQAKEKQTRLTEELREANREKNASLKRILATTEENLEGIWEIPSKRSRVFNAEDIAELAQTPVLPVTNKAALVRWKMGMVAEERPAARMRLHAKLLSELEARTSQSLGREVRVDVKVYKFAEDFADDVCAGTVDFGRMAALPFLRARRAQPALIPLVVPTTSSKLGIFFTRPDTGIQSMREIRGHSIALGDTNATVSYWAQIQMVKNGISATNLARYDFLDSTLEFAEDVQDLGYSNAVSRIGYLHSHAQVIESVLGRRYDVGVAREKAFRIHQPRGLVAIPGTEFQSSRNVMVARPNLDPKFVTALISAMTNLQGHWLEMLPDQSPGYEAVRTNAFEVEQQWLDRIETLFPPKPSPPRVPVPDTLK
jgi:ABC-type phosphate/phosphonate transport system substrate-binding protein